LAISGEKKERRKRETAKIPCPSLTRPSGEGGRKKERKNRMPAEHFAEKKVKEKNVVVLCS